MLKKVLLLLLVIAPLSIFAQEKIAYINAQEIFTQMPEFAGAQAKLKAKSDLMEKNAAAIENEYAALIKKFQESTEEPTVSLAADRQKQIDQLKERYESFVQTSQAELEKAQQEEYAPLQQKLRTAIKEVGDENNYTYIADAAMFLHIGAHAADANKQVKAKLGIKE
ncbi:MULTISPECIES: OmpH family outer membrane protein [unclassified Dysgonomonas]|uniref:OmpH family outer membrane protein n=1 Tax=unclassified Dysgonomonas TaxID=2630389 RepID=UPI0013EAA62F|nr:MULTISPECIES: OmpH family outer membrane protein [unclassified Dysgonomonas]